MGWLSIFDVYVWIWLALTVIFIIAELATVGLLTIWFAAGAIAALIFAAVGTPFALQIIVFLVVSIALLCLTRPLAQKYVNGRSPKTNVDAVVGQRAVVTERISNLEQSGRAVVLGQDWSVRTEDDKETIEKGELIEVIRVSGVKLIARKVKEE